MHKKKLNIIQGNTTCYEAHKQYSVDCQRTSCPNWILHQKCHNCVLIAAQNGAHTLQEIGQIYGLTRMRICQIEKGIYEKIRKIAQ